MKPRTALKRYTPIRKRRLTPRNRKTVIRLGGIQIRNLRAQCFARDKGKCQVCGVSTYILPRFDGDPEAYDMAHIRSRGAGGSDTLDNVRTKCHSCHMDEHTKPKGLKPEEL